MPRTAPYLLTLLIFLLAGWFPAVFRQSPTDLANGTFNTNAAGKPAGSISSSLSTSHSALGTLTSADGHRLTKLVSDNGLTQRVHRYLTDANNPTGYAQVIEETDPLAPSGQQLKKVHLYGHDLISSSVSQPSTLNHQLLFYSYDGLGSVRSITNESGDIEETYDYDAYGTLIGLAKRNATGDLESTPIYDLQSAITKSEFLFTGEQWDSDLNMYFLRARYMDTNTGRFHTQDTYEGRNGEPLTLHKYLYVHGNPVMGTDPSGHETMQELSIVERIQLQLANLTIRVELKVTTAGGVLSAAGIKALGRMINGLQNVNQIAQGVAARGGTQLLDYESRIQDSTGAFIGRFRIDLLARFTTNNVSRNVLIEGKGVPWYYYYSNNEVWTRFLQQLGNQATAFQRAVQVGGNTIHERIIVFSTEVPKGSEAAAVAIEQAIGRNYDKVFWGMQAFNQWLQRQ